MTDDRREYPPGIPCWIDLEVPDTEAARAFYGGLFGWEFDDTTPPGATGAYFVARLRDGEAAGITRANGGAAQAASAWNTYVSVADVDATLDRVRANGGQVTQEPRELPGAARVAAFTDPDGAALRLWQPTGHPGVQRANEPGSWNMNELVTPNPDGAKAFYAAVFGWEFTSVDYGAGETWMVRRPGYGEYLATHGDPDILERQEGVGAPAGFADVVGWMSRPSEGQAPDRLQWGLIFAVADADGIADRAVELGGSLIMAPMDAGPDVRLAIVADPFGAAFTINRYAPALEG